MLVSISAGYNTYSGNGDPSVLPKGKADYLALVFIANHNWVARGYPNATAVLHW